MGHNDRLGHYVIIHDIGMQRSIHQPVDLALQDIGICRIKRTGNSRWSDDGHCNS